MGRNPRLVAHRSAPGADDFYGKVRIAVTLIDRQGRRIKGTKTKRYTVLSTVEEVTRRLESALFGRELA